MAMLRDSIYRSMHTDITALQGIWQYVRRQQRQGKHWPGTLDSGHPPQKLCQSSKSNPMSGAANEPQTASHAP